MNVLLLFIYRKMMNTRWLMLSLLGGIILSVAVSSSMPIYKGAVLQRMLVKELERFQEVSKTYPGRHSSVVLLSKETEPQLRRTLIRQTDEFLEKELVRRYPLPVLVSGRARATDTHSFIPVDKVKYDPSVNRAAHIAAMEDLEDHIRVIDGRLPAATGKEGVYEALVVSSALEQLKIVLGQELELKEKVNGAQVTIVPVGVFDRKDEYDLFFPSASLSIHYNALFIPFRQFESDFTERQRLPVQRMEWNAALDYKHIRLSDALDLIHVHGNAQRYYDETFAQHKLTLDMAPTIMTYNAKEANLQTLLWSLNVPVLTLLAFYMFMVAHLIVDRQKTEIAVLRSRGAGKAQIIGIYAVESMLLAAAAMIPGLWMGKWFTTVLGASNGFLEFVNRAALQTQLESEAWLYGGVAALVSVLLILIPVYRSTRSTIVSHKQSMARSAQKPFWHKWFLDLALLLVSLYGMYMFRARTETLASLGLQSTDIRIDPLLFFVPSLFSVGAGLLLLRLYPWLVQFIYIMFRRWWKPSLYNTLISVGRSLHQYQFLMIFLILTMSTGIFSSSAARTLNENLDDQIRYREGADIRLTFRWENDEMPSGAGDGMDLPSSPVVQAKVQYSEPPFDAVRQLPGVQEAAKVFLKNEVSFTSGKQKGTTNLIAIDTDEFGRTSWMKDGLLPHHFYDYLNLIAPETSAVLISRSMANQYKLKEGDTITIGWRGVQEVPFLIYGIIDYFPTFNPLPQGIEKSGAKPKEPLLVVGHLSSVQNRLALLPYEAWVKLEAPSSRKELFQAIADKGMPLTGYRDSVQALADGRSDPFRLAVNGVMTMGFLLSVSICFFGFLLYWILSLKARTLQIGIFRAMGLTLREVVSMLGFEQLLTSGAALLIGFITGQLASRLFVPFFQLGFDPKSSVPPFQVSFDPSDTTRLTVMFGIMMIIALGILGMMMARIKINQAVKLGED